MTPAQQKEASAYLTSVKTYLDSLVNNQCADEDFMPELAGMAERVGVILSAVKAGYYTTNAPLTGIHLAANTRSTPYNVGDTTFVIAGYWECTRCNAVLRTGDLVDNLTSNLKHIDCDRPQG